MNPQNKIKIKWSSKFAYAIGLLTTDGNLSSDGRHINFTSKDLELAKIFKKCLALSHIKIGKKGNGKSRIKKYYTVQFGDVNFYKFLLHIGLSPAKSKTITEIDIPNKYFFDFLRGHFDGDGTFYSYWDPRWRNSFMFYTVFLSANERHIEWLRHKIYKFLKIKGYIGNGGRKVVYQLKYAKSDSLKLLPKMYYANNRFYLTRKYLKIKKCLGIINKKI